MHVFLPAHLLSTKLAEATKEFCAQKSMFEAFTTSLSGKTGPWQALIDKWNEDPDNTPSPYEYPEMGASFIFTDLSQRLKWYLRPRSDSSSSARRSCARRGYEPQSRHYHPAPDEPLRVVGDGPGA